jgi:chorismate lyase/3-hydroxybenzoate synthase
MVRCEYVPLSRLPGYLYESTGKILAVIDFGGETQGVPPLSCLHIKVDTRQMNNTRLVEVWTSSAPVLRNEHQGIHYAVSGDVLFGDMRLPESDQTAIDVVTRTSYQRIFDLLQTEAYPHLIRVWNYVPDINETANGLERYQLFCLGRHCAFSGCEPFTEKVLPAASSIGVRTGDLHIYFLAARQPARQIENPRQVSAFHYPRRYGPRSPSFSRAMLKEWEDGHQLYISGTASIVGHESCYEDNLERQLQEIMCNIESLIEHAEKVMKIPKTNLNTLSSMKTYIRHPHHLDIVKSFLEKHFSRELTALYLQGDICRSDLLLEIEAICHEHQY